MVGGLPHQQKPSSDFGIFECSCEIGWLPKAGIRADMGTENGDVAQIQMFLRRNNDDIFSGPKSFLYGASTNNQRIEAWWGYLRKHCMQYWMDIFHTLTENGDFCGDILDKNLVRFCFMRLVQVMCTMLTKLV